MRESIRPFVRLARNLSIYGFFRITADENDSYRLIHRESELPE